MLDDGAGMAGIPRYIAPRLKRGIFFSSPFALFGLIFFVVGCIFPVVFGAQSDYKSLLYFSDSDPVAGATLVAAVPTSASSNKRRIVEYKYRYQVQGQLFDGSSYSERTGMAPGQQVQVQYVAGQPGLSRIPGMLAAPFEWWVGLATGVLPLVGAGLLVAAFRVYGRNIALVTRGIVTTGAVLDKVLVRPGSKPPLYRVRFRFKARDGREHEASFTTSKVDRLGDEAREPLVYDPRDPSRAILLDTLPPEVRQQLTGSV